ncbi:transposase [soil metagenome]
MRSERRRQNSLRLPAYDYARPGSYFVTICVADRMPRFGEVDDGIVRMNDAGRIIDDQWRMLPDRFPHVAHDAYVIMPNHLHGILAINTTDVKGNQTLSSVIQAFKSLTTRAYSAGVTSSGWPEFDGRLWQRSYYDHVIRDQRDMERVRAYIADNPGRWFEDQEYHAWQHTLARHAGAPNHEQTR